MPSFNPSIGCGCSAGNRSELYAYSSPPEGETKFLIPDKCYRRYYDQCQVCGHIFGRHSIDLSELYSAEYVNSTYGNKEGMALRFDKIMSLPKSQSDNQHRVDRILGFFSRHDVNGRLLLDIGAGLGVFPAAMRERGWSVTAIEPDPRSVSVIREKAQVIALTESLFDINPIELGRFDLITLNKVLEHVENPTMFLAKAAQLVADSGFIYVELPDVAAASEGMDREEFFIEHHHIFSPTSLCILAQSSGLRLIELTRVREPSGKFTLVGWMAKH